jgi:hypothetical protein
MQLKEEAPKTTSSASWKGNKLEQLVPITSNRNGHKSNKNLKIMTSTSTQLPKEVIGAMVFAKMKLIPPLKMWSKTCQCTKRAFRHSR